MYIYIWGTKDLGKYTAANLKKKDYEITAFIDSKLKQEEKLIDGIEVLSYDDLKKTNIDENTCVLITAIGAKSIYSILQLLNELSVKNIGIIKARAERYHLPIEIDNNEIDGQILWAVKKGKRQILFPRIEINLIDNCNLKCKSCTHFSSLYNDESVYDLDFFEADLKRLREIGKILRLRLLGGEPLLLKNLAEYIVMARKIHMEADIELVTNGILFSQLDDATLKIIRDKEISVIISPYQPTVKMKDKIVKILQSYKIRYVFEGNEVKEFSRTLTLNNEHCSESSSEVCASSGCTFLRKGNLYKCPVEGLIKDFSMFYKLDKIFEQLETGYSIYNDNIEVEKKIKKLAMHPVEMCKFCSEKTEWIPWQVLKHPELKDWLFCEEL